MSQPSTAPLASSHRRDSPASAGPANAPGHTPQAPPAPAPPRRRPVSQKQRDEALNLPLVRQVIDLFDARLVDLREPTKPQPPPDKQER